MMWSKRPVTRNVLTALAISCVTATVLLMAWIRVPVLWIAVDAQDPGPREFERDLQGRPIHEPPSYLEHRHRMATALIVGQRKCGTGTLRKFLSVNPFIKTPPNENTYFDTLRTYLPGSFFYELSLPKAGPNDIVLDDRPRYFSHHETHARIARMNPLMKLVIILRDPTTRALSDYVHLQKLDRLSTSLTFEAVVSHDDSTINGDASIIRQGDYLRDIRHLLQYFPREHMLVLDGEGFIRNPVPILKEVEAFIGAPDYLRPTDFVYDESKGFYCEKVGNSTSCMEGAKGRPHPKIATELQHKIRAHFSPLNKQLKEFLHVDWEWLR